MRMVLRHLHAAAGPDIGVHVATHDGETLLEVRDAARFLEHLGALPRGCPLPADARIRGVVRHEGGAVFELFDSLGRLSAEAIRIEAPEAERLLCDLW